MKHSLLFLTLFSGLFFSCSSDSSSTDSQIIEKIIRYTPQFTNFETKKVTYYDTDNQSVIDSVFNSDNQFQTKTVYINTPLSTTANSYNASNALTLRVVEEFDGLGRMITLKSYGASGNLGWNYRYDYDDVNYTITRNSISSSGIATPIFLYRINDAGIAYYEYSFENDRAAEIIFDGDKPIRVISLDDLYTWDISYYSTPKPSNLRISNIRKNNEVLTYHLNMIIYKTDYYLNVYGDTSQVLMAFDGNDYPLTARRTFIPDVTNSWEDHYYYQ